MFEFAIGAGLLLLLVSSASSDSSSTSDGTSGGPPTNIEAYKWIGILQKDAAPEKGKTVQATAVSASKFFGLGEGIKTKWGDPATKSEAEQSAMVEEFLAGMAGLMNDGALVEGTIIGFGSGLKAKFGSAAKDDKFAILRVDKIVTPGKTETPKIGDLLATG